MDLKSKISEHFNTYKKFLLTNAEIVTSAESLFSSVLFFQSSRDNDYSSESINSVIGVVGLINDLIIMRYVKNRINTNVEGERDLINSIPPKKFITLNTINSGLRHIQLAAEMYTKYVWGERAKWKTITILETMKVIVKLILLYKNKGATLTHKYLPDRANFISILSKNKENIRNDDLDNIVEREERLELSRPTLKSIIGELLNIFRPLVYIFAIYLFRKKGEKIGWKPWLISLLTEGVSIYLTNRSTHSEQIEFNSRLSKLSAYLMRDPLFPIFNGAIGKILGLFDGFTLTSWFSAIIRSFLEYGNKYYFMNAST